MYNSQWAIVGSSDIGRQNRNKQPRWAGLAKVFKNGGYKYINEQCQTIIDASSYQYVTNFQKFGKQYLAQVTKNDITSTINTKGEVVFSAHNVTLLAIRQHYCYSDNGNITLVFDLTFAST